MVNFVITKEFNNILKYLQKYGYFNPKDIDNFEAYLENMSPSYNEIVNKAYYKYFKKIIDNDLNEFGE